ncbi:MAG: ABC transporter permease, partial [Asgard group archaeon]
MIWKDYEFLKLAIRNLNRRKVRNVLTVAGIIFSVSLVVGVNIASDSLELEVYKLVEKITGQTDIVISREDGKTFDDSLIDTIETIEGVAAVAPRLQRTAVIRAHTGENWNATSATILGIDPIRDRPFGELKDYNTSANIDDLIEQRKNIVLSETLIDGIAGEVDGQIVNISYGEDITLSYYNPEKGSKKIAHFTLKAYAKTEGKVIEAGTGTGVAFINIDKARWIFGVKQGHVDRLLVNLSEEAKKDPFIIVDKIKAAIGDKYDVIPVKENSLREATSIISGISMLIEISGLIALAATVFLIANAMVMTVSERTFEIGVLRSIGSGKLQIFRLFLYEICVLGIIGSLIGAVT